MLEYRTVLVEDFTTHRYAVESRMNDLARDEWRVIYMFPQTHDAFLLVAEREKPKVRRDLTETEKALLV